jgi:hypothetical protein
MVLKVFRNISSLCDVFQVSFSHHIKLPVYIDHFTKIDTQLHTEIKVEEIFKVISSKHERCLRFLTVPSTATGIS